MAKQPTGVLTQETGAQPGKAPIKIPTGTIRTPAVTKASAINNFNTRWQSRLSQLSKIKGINLDDHVKPVYEMDMKRVKNGQRGFTNSQVIDFISTTIKHQALVAKKKDSGGGFGGFVRGALGDIENIAGSLLPQNLIHELYKGGLGIDASVGRLVGDVAGLDANKSGKNKGFTNTWNDLQSFIPGYTQTARNVDKTFENLTKREQKGESPVKLAGEGLQTIRGVNLTPGSFTAGNLLQGKPGELVNHPVYTLLDLLPFAAGAGEAAAVGKYGSEEVGKVASKTEESAIIPKDSAWESLANGNPLQAATRATHITGPGSKVEELAQRWGVSKDIRDTAGVQAQGIREGSASEKYRNERQGYLRLAQETGIRLKKLNAMTKDVAREAYKPVEKIKADIAEAEKTPGWEPTGIQRYYLKQAEEAAAKQVKDHREKIAQETEQFRLDTENVRRVASTDMMDYVFRNHSTSREDIVAGLEKEGKTPTEIDNFIKDNYTSLYKWAGNWKVDAPFKNIIYSKAGDKEAFLQAMVPTYLTKAMDKLNKPFSTNPLGRGYQGATNVFKYAVLIGPRHTVHVLFSNGLFMALDDMGDFRPSVIARAFDAARHSEQWVEGLQRGVGTYSRNIGEEVRNFKTEEIQGIAQGKSLGRIARQVGESKALTSAISPLSLFNPRNYRRLEEFITDMSRAMVYFREHDKALLGDKGVRAATKDLARGQKTSMNLSKAQKAVEDSAHSAGLAAATRVLMDVDHMSPVERTIMRQVFPFYPFTRQLLRYLVKYPAEHPYKAAVLAAVGRMEMQDADTGLPLKYMSMFPITGVDSGGNQIFIDTKNMNPFRSLNSLSPWTLAGFMSELNPLITLPYQLSGNNILTATPELYPQLTVDPYSGSLVATHRGILEKTAGAIIPEANTLEAILGLNSQLNSLRQSDPTAYRQVLLSNLNLPFLPADKNLDTARIQYAKNQYQVAQQDTSAAVKSGDLSGLNYNVVPYQGRLYTVEQLKKLLAGG